MTSAVFDCVVFLQAAINDQSPAFACLALVESNQAHLYLSAPILSEVRDVLTRAKIQAKFPHLTQERADLFIQKVATLATLVNDVPDAGFPMRDADDLPYLNLAICTNASYLVTRDNDLLELMKDVTFTSKFPNLQIVDPVSFLKAVRQPQTP